LLDIVVEGLEQRFGTCEGFQIVRGPWLEVFKEPMELTVMRKDYNREFLQCESIYARYLANKRSNVDER
jgi:hypothetical protein